MTSGRVDANPSKLPGPGSRWVTAASNASGGAESLASSIVAALVLGVVATNMVSIAHRRLSGRRHRNPRSSGIPWVQSDVAVIPESHAFEWPVDPVESTRSDPDMTVLPAGHRGTEAGRRHHHKVDGSPRP